VGLVFVETKTPRSRRSVPLTSIAVEALRDHRDWQMGHPLPWEDSGPVFTNFSGRPMQPNTANSELKRALSGAGLPQIRVHDLRHTTASVLLETGTHPKVVQVLLGHKTIVTTLDTYSHVLPALHGDAITRLEVLVRGPLSVFAAARRTQRELLIQEPKGTVPTAISYRRTVMA
jgi:integrase